jgi:hypothetical protein
MASGGGTSPAATKQQQGPATIRFQGRFVFIFLEKKRAGASWPVGLLGGRGLFAKTQGRVRGPAGGYLQMSSPLSKAFGSRSGGPGGSFHSLHHMPGFHLIRSQLNMH